MKNIEERIFNFNRSPLTIQLREYYSRKSFLDILQKGRNETVHSAFIAWLLAGQDLTVSEDESPLMHLLELIVHQEDTAVEIRNAVLSREIGLFSINVETEKMVRDLCEIKTDDRLDIFVKCGITGVEGFTKLEIIIENKIGSSEGGARDDSTQKINLKNADSIKEEDYANFSQTDRYYLACSKECFRKEKDENLLQFFVYLTPTHGEEPSCKKFLHITYQDILDALILPLVDVSTITDRVRFILSEYVHCLGLPSDDNNSMAITKQTSDLIDRFCNDDNNNVILKECVIAVIRKVAGCSSSSEEKLLYSFFLRNKALLKVISMIRPNNFVSNAIKICSEATDKIKNSSIDDKGNRYLKDWLYFISKEGTIMKNAAIGEEVLKKFYDAHSKNEIDALNDAFRRELKKFYKDIKVEGDNVADFYFPLETKKDQKSIDLYKDEVYIVAKAGWNHAERKKDAFGKVMQYLINKYSQGKQLDYMDNCTPVYTGTILE